MTYFLLLLSVVLNAAAHICIKLGASQFAGGLSQLMKQPWVFIMTGYFLIGVFLFAASLVLYAISLSRINLSVAYPIVMSVAFIIVLGYSVWGLQEKVGLAQWLGIFLIFSGVLLVSLPTQQ